MEIYIAIKKNEIITFCRQMGGKGNNYIKQDKPNTDNYPPSFISPI